MYLCRLVVTIGDCRNGLSFQRDGYMDKYVNS